MDNNAIEEAKSTFAKIIEMYIGEYKKGLYDRDHGVMHNTGFVEGHPFHLDVGFLTKKASMQKPEGYRCDLAYVIVKINRWIKSSYPQYYETLSTFLAEQYLRNTGAIFNPNVDIKLFKAEKSFCEY